MTRNVFVTKQPETTFFQRGLSLVRRGFLSKRSSVCVRRIRSLRSSSCSHLSNRIRPLRYCWGFCHSEQTEIRFRKWLVLNHFLSPVHRDPQMTLSNAYQLGTRNDSLESAVLLITKLNFRLLFAVTVWHDDERNESESNTEREKKAWTTIAKELKLRLWVLISITFVVSVRIWRDFVSNQSEDWHWNPVQSVVLHFLSCVEWSEWRRESNHWLQSNHQRSCGANDTGAEGQRAGFAFGLEETNSSLMQLFVDLSDRWLRCRRERWPHLEKEVQHPIRQRSSLLPPNSWW